MTAVRAQRVLESAAYQYSRARSLGFTLEYTALNALSLLLPGARKAARDLPSFDPALIGVIREQLFSLLKKDAHEIGKGSYPVSVLKPEAPFSHLGRIPRLIWDGLSIYRRRVSGRTTEFTGDTLSLLEELPRYYRRNFHFQTDGYLSSHSAELYEHQVEMLFGGAADAMRRLIVSRLRAQFGQGDGKGLTFLEVGAGTGRATRFVHLAFPRARIVATDLSEPYLKEAQKRLRDLSRIDYLQGDGAHLPFQDGTFDAAYSVFLFHELPLEARKEVLRESVRVTRPGGFLGLVDSLQLGDVPVDDLILSAFPKQFHEPFFRNYLEHPMEEVLKELGVKKLQTEYGFFSKVCSAVTPAARRPGSSPRKA